MWKYTWSGLHSLLLFAIIVGLLLCPALPVYAQNHGGQDLTVVLVIDSSGSMNENDSDRLRLNAAKIFVDLLSPSDRIGVIDFDSEVQVPVSVRKVSSGAKKQGIKDTIDAIDADGGTDIGGALQEAYNQLAAAAAPAERGMVVLLTDGEPDLESVDDDTSRQVYINQLDSLVAAFDQQKWPVHTVALTESADVELLRQISRQTHGGSYLASHASQLATTFTDIVWSLKNQITLVHEKLSFDEETAEAQYEVELDQYTEHVTILAVSSGAASFTLEVYDPEGNAHVHVQQAFREKNYTLASLPPEAGKWNVKLMGSGSIELFVAADKRVKVSLEEPQPNSRLPMGKELSFSGSIWHNGERIVGDKWRLEAELTQPGGESSKVQLQPPAEDAPSSSFSGSYSSTDVLGDYTVTLRAFEGQRAVAWQTFHLYIDDIPLVDVQLWHNEKDFRQGDKLGINAELVAGGSKLNPAQESDPLELDEFQAVLRPIASSDDSAAREIPLFDDGSSLHSDAVAQDGSFGNILELTDTGGWEVEVSASGRYKGRPFRDSHVVSSFEVLPAARVLASLEELDSEGQVDWLSPGSSRQVTILLQSDSTRAEEVVLEKPEESAPIVYSEREITLQPGESKRIRLDLAVADEANIGQHDVKLQLAIENPGVSVEPETLGLSARVRSSRDVFLHRFGVPLMVIGGIVALLLLIVIVGNVLYSYSRFRQQAIHASLIYWPQDGERELSGRRLKLRSGALGSSVVIASESQGKEADYVLPEIKRPFSFMIASILPETSGPQFISGFKSLLNRQHNTGTEVRGLGRTRLSYGGLIRVSVQLYSGDSFEVGGYVFEYYDERRKDVSHVNLDVIPEHVAAHESDFASN